MSKILKRIGQHTYPSGQKQWKVLAECDCGKKFETLETSFYNKNPSCGCKRLKRQTRKYGKEIQKRWRGILKRVCNSGWSKESTNVRKCYDNIKMCDEWLNSQDAFYDWAINNGFEPKLHIDRIDGTKGYSPENCRWITQQENNRNGARSKLSEDSVKEILKLHGVYSSKDIAKTFNITTGVLCNIAKGRIWNDIWIKNHTQKNIKRVHPTKVKSLPTDYAFYDELINVNYSVGSIDMNF